MLAREPELRHAERAAKPAHHGRSLSHLGFAISAVVPPRMPPRWKGWGFPPRQRAGFPPTHGGHYAGATGAMERPHSWVGEGGIAAPSGRRRGDVRTEDRRPPRERWGSAIMARGAACTHPHRWRRKSASIPGAFPGRSPGRLKKVHPCCAPLSTYRSSGHCIVRSMACGNLEERRANDRESTQFGA